MLGEDRPDQVALGDVFAAGVPGLDVLGVPVLDVAVTDVQYGHVVPPVLDRGSGLTQVYGQGIPHPLHVGVRDVNTRPHTAGQLTVRLPR